MLATADYVRRGVSRYARCAIRRYRQYAYWRRNEKMLRTRSREEIRAAQWDKLKAMLRYASDRVPFYRERFEAAGLRPEDIRRPDDLSRLPLLTKDDVRRNFPDRLTEPGKEFRPSRLGQTSGSTAESMHYLRPDRTWHRELYYSVFLRAGGLTNLPIFVLSTPHCTADTCSIEEDSESGGVFVGKAHRVPLAGHMHEMIGLPSTGGVLGAPEEYFALLCEPLNHFSPCLIVADPVYLAAFARYLRDSNASVPEVVSIITTYELLTGSLRDLIEGVFGCEVYTEYGGSEVLDVANECQNHTLHVMPENVWVEVLRDGRPAEPGELGRVVLTDLCNCNMPFIRYDIGDVVEVGDGHCPCGKNTDTFRAVHGRTCDLLPTRNGPASPLQADAIFRGVRGVAFYRLVQVQPDRYNVSIMPEREEDAVDTEEVLRRARGMLGGANQFRIAFVDELEPERSNKFRFVYSECASVEL